MKVENVRTPFMHLRIYALDFRVEGGRTRGAYGDNKGHKYADCKIKTRRFKEGQSLAK